MTSTSTSWNALWRRLLPLAAASLAACASVPNPEPTASAAVPAAAPAFGASGTAAPGAARQALPAGTPADAVAAADAPTQDEGPATAVALDPLAPTAKVDLDAQAAKLDLWVRIRRGVAIPDLSDEYVAKWEKYYSGKPDYVQRMTERGGRYLFHIVEEVNRRGMPTELALLPFVESAFNPQAASVARASGMWQFIPGTGRDFKLRQNIFRDDRRDVLASTRAALDYLTKLHGMFGDWQLALAAYNWGEGSVKRAIKRNEAAGLPTDYSSLKMPAETRNYVPKLQAIKNLFTQPERYGITLSPLQNHPYFLSVAIDRDIDVDRAAQLAGLPLDEFKALNPQMNKPVILAAGTPQILLPYDNANTFVRAVTEHRGQLASWTAWTAPRTLLLPDAARLTGMSVERLREINRIPPRMLVRQGSVLLVPRSARRDVDVAPAVADNASLALAPQPPDFIRKSFHAGRKGTTVAAVADEYDVTPAQVRAWNPHARRGRFKRGQVIHVVVRNPAAIAVAQVSRGARGATAAALEAEESQPPVSRRVAAAASRAEAQARDQSEVKAETKAETQAAKQAQRKAEAKAAAEAKRTARKTQVAKRGADNDDEEDTPAAKRKGRASAKADKGSKAQTSAKSGKAEPSAKTAKAKPGRNERLAKADESAEKKADKKAEKKADKKSAQATRSAAKGKHSARDEDDDEDPPAKKVTAKARAKAASRREG